MLHRSSPFIPGSSTSARIRSRGEFGEFRERLFAAADSKNFKIPLTKKGFIAFAGVFLVLDDQDALLSCEFSEIIKFPNLPAVGGNAKAMGP